MSSPASSRPSVLFISEVFHPDATSTSQLFSPLLAELSDDAEITVYCGFPTRHATRPGPYPRREQWRGLRIERCGLAIDKKKSLLHRGLAYGGFLAHVLVKLLVRRRPRLVCAVTNPPMLGIVVRLAQVVRRFPYQYMLLDLYPEGLVALGKLHERSFTVRLWKRLNRWVYRGAASLPILGRDMISVLRDEYGVPASKCRYVPHWSVADIEPMPVSQNAMARDLGLRDKFIVQYSGNMGLWHDMLTLVGAAAALADQPHIHFLFIGDGVARDAAKQRSDDLALSNVTWLDYQPKDRLPISLTCSHVALISLRQGLEGVAVPSKLYGILAAGRAVIAQAPSACEVAMTIRDHACGRVVPPADAPQLAEEIRALAQQPATVAQLGRRARAAFEAHYTLNQAADAFRALWGVGDSAPENRW